MQSTKLANGGSIPLTGDNVAIERYLSGSQLKPEDDTMNEQTLAIIVFGSIVVAFAFISSYMAMRQKDREQQVAKAKTDIEC